jgi:uncharacterized protein YbbC (DUF1343 family)
MNSKGKQEITKMAKYILLLPVFFFGLTGCGQVHNNGNTIGTGAENTLEYLHWIQDRPVAIVANQSSLVGSAHLLDTLLALGIDVKKVFSPEHGFRGTEDHGALIDDQIDAQTGIPVVSLYGKSKKPTVNQLRDIEVVLFDLQDVGVRFYTYLSTLHYVMQACGENQKSLVVLDRPNPNGFYTDGPVLDTLFRSFVGIYPIPVVHGMTLGELALMALGEGWVCPNDSLDIQIAKCTNYEHDKKYRLPVRPSPNLPNMQSIYLYPSLCFFEGTPVSIGRGTDVPFQVFGHPGFTAYDTVFIPKPGFGSKQPVLQGQACYGYNLAHAHIDARLNLGYLIGAYHQLQDKDGFFTDYFTLLAGTPMLQQQIEEGKTESEIRASWQEGLERFKSKRSKYLLYP